MVEPDQIDMMNESDLREELRKVVDENIALRAVYEAAQEFLDTEDAEGFEPEQQWKLEDAIAAVQTTEQGENDG